MAKKRRGRKLVEGTISGEGRVYKTKYDKYRIIDEYASGDYSYKQLSDKHNLSIDRVTTIVKEHIASILNAESTRTLLASQKVPMKTLKVGVKMAEHFWAVFEKDKANEEFLALLSSDDSPYLTEEEKSFAWKYVYGASIQKAIEESGLDAGLLKPRDNRETSVVVPYVNSCKLRATYLRNKPNLKVYIESIRTKHLSLPDINKEFILRELLREMDELREDKSAQGRKLFGQTVDRITRVTGMDSATVNINQANADNALDILIDMKKKAEGIDKAIDHQPDFEPVN